HAQTSDDEACLRRVRDRQSRPGRGGRAARGRRDRRLRHRAPDRGARRLTDACAGRRRLHCGVEGAAQGKVVITEGCHHLFERRRIGRLAYPGTFEERDTNLESTDPLGFRDTKKYRDRIRAAVEKTKADEAVITGVARIGGVPSVLCVFEFGFLGGSMGSVVGEKLTRAIELAIDKHLPVVIVSASGGARMQEGILSLMQMARTAAALERLGE